MRRQNRKLSPTEMRVLKMLPLGDQEIAFQLSISYLTVRTHINRIFLKLDAYGRTQAVVIAIKEGIVRVDDFILQV